MYHVTIVDLIVLTDNGVAGFFVCVGGKRLAVVAVESFSHDTLPEDLDEANKYCEVVLLLGKALNYFCSVSNMFFQPADHLLLVCQFTVYAIFDR